jgi:hypothetical protein
LFAWERTAPSDRPSFNPITRVGVFFFARLRSCCRSLLDHGWPLLRVDWASPAPFSQLARISAPTQQSHDASTCAGNRASAACRGYPRRRSRHAHCMHSEGTTRKRRGTEVRQRRHQVGVRLLPEELEKLRELAERDGVSPAEVLRKSFLAITR